MKRIGILIFILLVAGCTGISNLEVECAEDGEYLSDVANEGPQECCDNLNTLAATHPNSDTGECALGAEAPLCTSTVCGNSICEYIENVCNCPEDCDIACRDENYKCTISDIPCCPGLKSVLLADEDEEGECFAPLPCGSICAPCGDGVCEDSRFENKCTCPEDCKNV